MSYKKLTVDQACQLEQQAGNEAAKIIDDLVDDMTSAKSDVTALKTKVPTPPTTNGNYMLTVVVGESGGKKTYGYAWTAYTPAE